MTPAAAMPDDAVDIEELERLLRTQHTHRGSEKLEALAPRLAARVVADAGVKREAEAALEEAKAYRVERGEQRECVGEVHGNAHHRCGKCFICLERKALAKLRGATDG